VRPDGRTSKKYTAHRKDGCAIALARKELKGLASLRLTLFFLRSVYVFLATASPPQYTAHLKDNW
jgi:hypothetical protein